MAARSAASEALRVVRRALGNIVRTRTGRFRNWPDTGILLDAPLALAEERTHKLRRIYAHASRDLWDGPRVFRDAMTRHGGIQLSREKRVALSHPITGLMWGELAAWIVSAELAERLEDPDARLAASSQVFDEARHFYVLRDYLAALHVPAPTLDPYYAVAFRRLLGARDLTVKLFAMQILAEGAAVVIFRFLAERDVEPVLSELLPYIEKDESRHVGLGVLHLPERLKGLSSRELMRLRDVTYGIGDMFGAAQIRMAAHYRVLGAEPRELIRAADKMLYELSERIGPAPGTDLKFFATNPVTSPDYDRRLDAVLPEPGRSAGFAARAVRRLVDGAARAIA
jgi:hypothetical protein